ncbi:XRE family transcriptional regulator [Vreelandella alkaliphila]|uniref:LexA family transcriptional regulator n=1 Tax=Vreelandella alkaliphila TaxID=272774 RepID=A0AAJ2RW59_9GAMM|nr:LexA family transcriptional regulator [Halomonas alkaliphila]MDX5979578.1 LexA family transcriptional regulator [Halomonas alkaliphila]
MELSIRETRVAAGLKVGDLAARLGTSVANMSRWEREPQRVNLVTLEKIAAALSVPPESLISKGSQVPVGQVSGATKTLVVTVKSLQEGKPDFPFDRNYLLTITNRPHTELASGIVVDDAMFPTLRIGDALLIEPCERVEQPGIYASMRDGKLMVRRIMEGLDQGSISVMTDNDSYPDFEDVEASRFPVTGRVIWIGRSFGAPA